MSAPSGDSTGAPGNSGAFVIVLVALGLMALAGIVAFLFFAGGRSFDGLQLMQERLGVRDVGEGFAVAEARAVPLGSRIVVWKDRRLADEVEPPVAPASEPAAAGSQAPKFDWKAVVIPPATTGPRTLYFVFPPDLERGRTAIDETLGGIGWTDLDDLGRDGGRVLVAREKSAWRGYDASWVHVREFQRGGGFRDSMQVDLSLPQSPCLLTATWTRGEAASRASLEALLARLTPP